MMNRRTLVTAVATLGFCAVSPLAPTGTRVAAQEGHTLHAERTIDFQTRKVYDLKAQVGPVRIASVELTDMGRNFGGGGLAGRMRPGTDSEVSTTIRAHFLAENPTSEDWQVTFTLEYLDKNGKLIDRATKREKWDGEAKPYDFDHHLLEYVIPLIAQVKIKLEAKLD